jgi:hypothetical protein
MAPTFGVDESEDAAEVVIADAVEVIVADAVEVADADAAEVVVADATTSHQLKPRPSVGLLTIANPNRTQDLITLF